MKTFKARTFTWLETALVKVCFLSVGILLGLYFYDYFVSLIMLWWFLFIFTATYCIIRLSVIEQ